MGRRVLADGGGARDIENALWDMVMGQLAQYGFKDSKHPAIKFMGLDIRLNADGINLYLEKAAEISNSVTL
jgi:hypothetical protein